MDSALYTLSYLSNDLSDVGEWSEENSGEDDVFSDPCNSSAMLPHDPGMEENEDVFNESTSNKEVVLNESTSAEEVFNESTTCEDEIDDTTSCDGQQTSESSSVGSVSSSS